MWNYLRRKLGLNVIEQHIILDRMTSVRYHTATSETLSEILRRLDLHESSLVTIVKATTLEPDFDPTVRADSDRIGRDALRRAYADYCATKATGGELAVSREDFDRGRR